MADRDPYTFDALRDLSSGTLDQIVYDAQLIIRLRKEAHRHGCTCWQCEHSPLERRSPLRRSGAKGGGR